MKTDRLTELINHEILWASEEIKALPRVNDGTENSYFEGYILAMNKAKQIIKKVEKE